MNNIFSNSQCEFLKTYVPESSLYTTSEEMGKIIKIFNIEKCTIEEIKNIRNNIVIFYHNLMKDEIDTSDDIVDTKRILNYSYAMGSIACTLDIEIDNISLME
jgi:hypothetical protein